MNRMKRNTSAPSLKKFYRSREVMVHESVRYVTVPAERRPDGVLMPEYQRRIVTGGTYRKAA